MKYLIALVLILTACTASEPAPDYLVRTGSLYNWRCGGMAIDDRHIITANHCGLMTIAQTGDGTEVGMQRIAQWPELDAALYETAVAMQLDSHAQLRSIIPGEPAYAFGFCPMWRASAARFAEYRTTETEPLYCHELHIVGAWICSGDSGGVIEQGGAVVGMIAQFRGDAFASEGGVTTALATCAVPGEAIAERVEEWRKNR